jgi:chlorophyll(ide) b reductase
MFNLICELPETVARTLVPRMRVVKGSGKAINYLTPPRILLALVTAWVRRGRWFDDEVHRYTYFVLNIHLDLALI